MGGLLEPYLKDFNQKKLAPGTRVLGTLGPFQIHLEPQVTKGAEPLNAVYYNDREFEHE